jgi:hypothetical protein
MPKSRPGKGARSSSGQAMLPVTSDPRGSNPAIASASVDLPEPLSPMAARRSPAPRSRLMSINAASAVRG